MVLLTGLGGQSFGRYPNPIISAMRPIKEYVCLGKITDLKMFIYSKLYGY